jgi:hypothetical protein
MDTGNCSRLKSDSATNALSAVSSWPVRTYTENVASETRKGDVDQMNVVPACDGWGYVGAYAARARYCNQPGHRASAQP